MKSAGLKNAIVGLTRINVYPPDKIAFVPPRKIPTFVRPSFPRIAHFVNSLAERQPKMNEPDNLFHDMDLPPDIADALQQRLAQRDAQAEAAMQARIQAALAAQADGNAGTLVGPSVRA